MLSKGSDAPKFELPDQDGELVSLSNILTDQYVVVFFFPRANTEGCTTEACGFRDNWDQFRSLGIEVIGISDDPITDLKKFQDDHELPIILLSDEQGEVATAYESYGEKQMFGNTFDGVYRNTYVISPEGKIVLAYEDVEPAEHASEILADIEALA